MLSEDNFSELESKGYTVVPGVIPEEECDTLIAQYRDWLEQFREEWIPLSRKSLVNTCNVGHLEPTWAVRLKARHVFAQLWKTDKLLTSFDAIALGRPPEHGGEQFQDPSQHWLHVDQNASRIGTHAYQGAVYLEEQCEDDWTLQVIQGSHKFIQEFFKEHPSAAKSSEKGIYYQLWKCEDEFFLDKGCTIKRVPVPKGAIVLWDSQLIHANAAPLQGRTHKGRWRYTVFVSMTPAIWASDRDMEVRKRAYENAMMTSHWSSQGVKAYKSFKGFDIQCPEEVPEIGQSMVAKQLAGVEPYVFDDGEPTGKELKPVWAEKTDISDSSDTKVGTNKRSKYGRISCTIS